MEPHFGLKNFGWEFVIEMMGASESTAPQGVAISRRFGEDVIMACDGRHGRVKTETSETQTVLEGPLFLRIIFVCESLLAITV